MSGPRDGYPFRAGCLSATAKAVLPESQFPECRRTRRVLADAHPVRVPRMGALRSTLQSAGTLNREFGNGNERDAYSRLDTDAQNGLRDGLQALGSRATEFP